MEHSPHIILVDLHLFHIQNHAVSHSPLSSCSSHDSTHSIGYGDICPGNAGTLGKLFVMTLAGAGMGFFCGPLLQLGGAWRHAIPGGLPALASFVIGMGIVIFVSVEGLDHLDAVYASIVTGKRAASGLGWNVAVYICGTHNFFLCMGRLTIISQTLKHSTIYIFLIQHRNDIGVWRRDSQDKPRENCRGAVRNLVGPRHGRIIIRPSPCILGRFMSPSKSNPICSRQAISQTRLGKL